jgi:hypothetical protein
MERIGNAGWFVTDEEYEKLLAALDILSSLLGKKMVDNTLTGGYDKVNLPYDGEPIEINKPGCPNCPWKNPNPNIGDWTWRPWQAPWYGDPGEPISPKEWKVGDGEWWKHQPYCTSTTEDNPNAVKDSRTNDPDNIMKCQ